MSHSQHSSGKSPDSLPQPERVGPYKILEPLAEGGMGMVYLARQTEPVKRQVALKVIKPGMDTKQVIARFEAERQALAVMDHPNIAKVFDGGTTEEGRPYFAMEYVAGVSITEYCDMHKLSVRARLQLFQGVCQAVQHAHQKGVIHRDLKPTNILVAVQDGQPVPKVIDFGIAKAIGPSLTEKTLHTQLGQLIGTPAYMSPEQAEMTGLDVDTRTDIYSLGVILYELLAGELPYEHKDLQGFGAIVTLRDTEAPRPSLRFDTLGERRERIADCRSTDPGTLARRLKGDLDWIVMKAIEKDRTRRYDTANALLFEIGRYLNDEPVLARAPSASYRMGKFVRRHKAGVAAGAAAALALVVGAVLATAGMVRASQAEAAARAAQRQAEQEAATAEQVSDFLVGLFKLSDPSEARGNEITAREILDRGAERIEAELADQPLVQARLLHTVGSVYRELALLDASVPSLERALELREANLGPDHLDVAANLNDLGEAYLLLDQYQKAQAVFERALQIYEHQVGAESLGAARALVNLAAVLRQQETYDQAIAYSERAFEIIESASAPDQPRKELGGVTPQAAAATTLLYLGILRRDLNAFAEAEVDLQRGVQLMKSVLGPDHPRYASSLISLGYLYFKQGDYTRARAYYRQSLETLERVFEPDHPEVATALNELARAECSLGDLSSAESLWRRSLQIREKRLGAGHSLAGQGHVNLGNALAGQGRFREAEIQHQQAMDIFEAAQGPQGEGVALVLNSRAFALALQGRGAQAESLLNRAIAIYETVGVDHPEDRGWALQQRANLHRDVRQFIEAERLYKEAIELYEQTSGLGNPDFAGLLDDYSDFLRRSGLPAEADAAKARADSVSSTRRLRSC